MLKLIKITTSIIIVSLFFNIVINVQHFGMARLHITHSYSLQHMLEH